jgi:hypothetical protein
MTTKSDFMAAEEIKAILTGRDQTEQERIIRWVNESLGLLALPKRGDMAGVLPSSLPPVSAKTGVETSSAPAHSVKKDIRSFVDEKQPKNDVQFAVVAAYFYRFAATESERKDTITSHDLDNAARQARGYGFKKSVQTLSNARNLGYFDSAGRGEFKLNAVGENLVAMTLPGTAANVSGAKAGKRKIKRSKARVKTPTKATKKSGLTHPAPVKRSKISAAGRAKIAAAQKARWAKAKEQKTSSEAK